MILEQLSILNYKNIEQVELSLSPKVNCFLGYNGMGKTNLLDAIYYLSFCKSHTNLIDSQNIKQDANFAMIQAWYLLNQKKEEIFCSLKRKSKKQFKRNKKEYVKLSDHIGLLPLVMISPADIDLIMGGSEERRKFLDVVISQFDHEYLHALIRYNKALQQRNALLKMDGVVEESLFELWEDQLAHEANLIYNKRTSFISEFTPTFQHYYNTICQSSECVELIYQSHLSDRNLGEILKQTRERDRIIGHTSCGIHRDELEMKMNSLLMKKVGSQGQNKTYIIALKFAQFDFLLKANGATPILLLDDIFDKLDSLRVEEIIKIVSGQTFGQIFITDTNREHLTDILNRISNDYHLYEVEKGNVVQVKLN